MLENTSLIFLVKIVQTLDGSSSFRVNVRSMTFDLLILNTNEFPGLIVEHFCVKFCNPSCIGF